jgi:uncharacterized repeat protein (TIGR02543 family)
MNGNKDITANFLINTYTLTTHATNGSVTLAPPTGPYNDGTSVQLTAVPISGSYHFVGWSGDTVGKSAATSPMSVIMTANRDITAKFEITAFTLNINIVGNGSVAKNPDQLKYDSNSTVQLTATPAPGNTFTGWSVDASGTTNPLTVTMDGNKNITANFTLVPSGIAPVDLLSNVNFVVLAGSAVTNIPTSNITGDVGLSPAAGSFYAGLTQPEVTGTIYTVNAAGPAGYVIDVARLTAAKGDLTIAYNDAAGRTPVPTGPFLNPGAGNIGGLNLVAGLYKFTGSAAITGSDVTLTGSATDVWIFQIGTNFNVGNGIKVLLGGSAQAKNIFWQVGTSATLGTTSHVEGTIMADQLISLATGATLNGRALTFTGAVTLDKVIIVKPL